MQRDRHKGDGARMPDIAAIAAGVGRSMRTGSSALSDANRTRRHLAYETPSRRDTAFMQISGHILRQETEPAGDSSSQPLLQAEPTFIRHRAGWRRMGGHLRSHLWLTGPALAGRGVSERASPGVSSGRRSTGLAGHRDLIEEPHR